MTTTSGQGQPAPEQVAERPHDGETVVAKFRRPHVDRTTWLALAVWVAGLVLATVPAALVVPPSQEAATLGAVSLAVALTLLGSMVVVAAGIILWKHHDDSAVLTFGAVPAVALVTGGVIMAATKLTAGA